MEYTFVVSHMFAAWAVPALGDIVKGQAIATEVDVLDGGNNKGEYWSLKTTMITQRCPLICMD